MAITQQQVLKYTLEHPQWISKVQPEIFNDTLSGIFYVAQRLDRSGRKPTLQVLQYVCEKRELLSELAELPQVFGANDIDESTFKEVKDDLREVAVKRFIDRYSMMDKLNAKDLKHFNERLHALMQEDEPDILGQSTSFFDFKSHIPKEGIVVGSGLEFLNNTGSDFKKGELAAFLAPSGHGKSQLLGHVAKHLFMTKKNVLTIVFEETEAQYKLRIGKGLLQKTTYQYKQLTPEQLEREFSRFSHSMGNLDVITGSSVAVEDLENIVKREEEKNGYVYDAIIIDYSKQLVLKGANKNSQEYQMISNVFRLLKEFAMRKDEEKLVVTAVQANREGYGKRKTVGAENIADSMGPMHNADIMISVKRKDIQESDLNIKEEDLVATDIAHILKLHIVKKRDGSVKQGSNYYYNLRNDSNIEWVSDVGQHNDYENMFDSDDPFDMPKY